MMEEAQNKVNDLNAQLELVTYQRDLLAFYAKDNPNLVRDLCREEKKAKRCPCHLYSYEDTDPDTCRTCILRNLPTLLKNAGIAPYGHPPKGRPPLERVRIDGLYVGREVIETDDLPFHVDMERWGEVNGCLLICPGVYLLGSAKGDCTAVVKEEAANIFSSEALAYGMEDGGAIFFPSHDGTEGDYIIRYELHRHLVLHGYPTDECDTLQSIALFGAEEEPEYFGAPAPPVDTPHGHLTRYIRFKTGIFFIETDECEQMLALSHPVWGCDLSEAAVALAEMTNTDKYRGIYKTEGYLFYSRTKCAVPLYELLLWKAHPELEPFITSRTALLSAIWKYCPEYAVRNNAQEQMGMGESNILFNIFQSMGIDIPELRQKPRDFIPYIPDEQESEFLKLPDSWRLDSEHRTLL